MAKKVKSKSVAKAALFYSVGREFVYTEKEFQEVLQDGTFVDGDDVEIFQKVGEKRIKETSYELV